MYSHNRTGDGHVEPILREDVADPLAWLPHRRWHGAAWTRPRLFGLVAIRTATKSEL